MSDDYNAGYDAARRGSIFGPSSSQGTAGWLAGAAAAQTQSSGSAEWFLAPFLLAPFVAIFYPIATACALVVALTGEALTGAVGLGAMPSVRWPLLLVATVAVFWIVCRRDQHWGLKSRPYYIARHIARMLIFALLANGAAHNGAATAANRPAMGALDAMFSTPVYWMPVLLMLLFWQIFFMRAYHFRVYWNIKLKSWHFRPKEFPAFYFSWGRKAPEVQPQAPIPMPGRLGTFEENS